MKRLSLFIPMTALLLILFSACGSPEDIARDTGSTATPTEDIFAASTGRKAPEARGRTSDRTSTRATPAVRGESARESSNRARPTPGVNLNEVRATPLPPAPAFVKAWGIDPKIEMQTDGTVTYDYEDPPSYGEGEFYKPRNIAVASDGSVYVSDFGHSGESGFRRIQKSTSDGEFTQYLALSYPEEYDWHNGTKYLVDPPVYCTKTPKCGVEVVTGPDVIFVVDDSYYSLANNYALMEFASDGVSATNAYKGNFDFGPALPHSAYNPLASYFEPIIDVAVDVDGNVYMLFKRNSLHHPVYKYTSEAVEDESWDSNWKKNVLPWLGWDCSDSVGLALPKTYNVKDGPNEECSWDNVSHIAVGPDGSVYVTTRKSITRLDQGGNFISEFGINDDKRNYSDIAVAPDGSVYVVGWGRSSMYKFTSDGVFVTSWGSKGTGNGQFNRPRSVAVAPDGSIYVLDRHRIQKFSPGS